MGARQIGPSACRGRRDELQGAVLTMAFRGARAAPVSGGPRFLSRDGATGTGERSMRRAARRELLFRHRRS